MRGRFVLLVALALLPASAGAQESSNPWDPYIGCWWNPEGSGEQQLCYLPVSGSVAVVEQVALRNESVVSRTRLDARGTRQPVEAEGCEGFEATARSADGIRLYTRGELRCGSVRQLTSTLMTLSARGELIRIAAVIVGEQQALVTERLAPVPISDAPVSVRSELEAAQPRVRGARVEVLRLLDVAQIEAALHETDAVVVEAWMVEATRDTKGFRAPRRMLERLAAAGAPAGVLDMAVMLGNPDHFDVHEATSTRSAGGAFAGDPFGRRNNWAFCSSPAPLLYTPEMAYWAMWGYGAFFDPWAFRNGCDPFGYANRFGFRVLAWDMFSPWFGGVNRWDPRFGRGVVFTPVTGGSLSRTIPLGRVEKARGYAPSSAGGRSGGAQPRSSPANVRQPANGTAANTGAHTSSSGSSGSSSGGVRERTESSSSTGRTAAPRDPDKRP